MNWFLTIFIGILTATVPRAILDATTAAATPATADTRPASASRAR